MTIVYLPTWMVDFYGFHVDIQYMDPMGIYIYIILPSGGWTFKNISISWIYSQTRLQVTKLSFSRWESRSPQNGMPVILLATGILGGGAS